jgi:exopolyphosphatase/guanosine-5'-triphosphate,3'-diphosphate pyrophosphatase
MNIASIDVGSNSVLLLTAELNTEVLRLEKARTYYATPRISEGITSTGEMNANKIDDLFNVLSNYERIIHSDMIENVIVSATKAFRQARNAEMIKAKIENRFGWKTNIISGDDEARLTFLGTTYPFKDSGKLKIVIDIGGGSTEIVIGNKDRIIFKNSFNIGAVSLTEKYFKKDLLLNNETNFAISEIESLFKVLPKISDNDVDIAISVAGTPTSLACIKLGIRDFDEDLVDGSLLSLKEIHGIRLELIPKTPVEILNQYGSVVAGREDVLLAGVLILEGAMKSLDLENITVSTKGLRYGAVYDYLGWI